MLLAGAQRQAAFVSGNVVAPLREAFDTCVAAYRDHGHGGACRSLHWAMAVLDFPQHHIPQRRPWAQESQLTLARDANRRVTQLRRTAHPSASLLRRYLLPRPGNLSLSVGYPEHLNEVKFLRSLRNSCSWMKSKNADSPVFSRGVSCS